MSLTLGAELAAACDSLERSPVVEIVSGQFIPDKPFPGSYYTDEADPEKHSDIITTSLDIVISLYVENPLDSGAKLIMMYTDENKSYWTKVELVASSAISHAALTEMTDGNIGIVFFTDPGFWEYAYTMVVTPTGSIVSGPTQFATFGGDYAASPTLETIGANSYILAYTYYNGSTTWSLQKRTSSNFTSWSGPSTITTSGMVAAQHKRNPWLLDTTADGLLCFFDYVEDIAPDGTELRNVWYVQSDDGGSTWGAPVKATSYAQFGTGGVHPSAAERDNGTVELAYHEIRSVIEADDGMTGWCSSPSPITCTAQKDSVTMIHYDSARGLVMAGVQWPYTGTNSFCAVNVIDPTTMTVTRCYSSSTTPAFNSVLNNMSVNLTMHSEGKYFAVGGGIGNSNCCYIAVVNDETETIAEYVFNTDSATWGLVANCAFNVRAMQYWNLACIHVSEASDTMYVLFNQTVAGSQGILVKIDLTEAEDPVTGYSVTEVAHMTQGDASKWYYCYLDINEDIGWFVVTGTGWAGYRGHMIVGSLGTGSVLQYLIQSENSSFHYNSCSYPKLALVGGVATIYGNIAYMSTNGQEDRRGLIEINCQSWACFYRRPSYATVNNYGLYWKTQLPDGRMVMPSFWYGVAIYDPLAQTWELMSNDTHPGMDPSTNDDHAIYDVAYDPVSGMFWAAFGYVAGYQTQLGAIGFMEDGSILRGYYKTGTWGGASWSYTAAQPLTLGLRDHSLAITIDDENVIWAAWERDDDTETSIKWDNEAVSKDLSDLLVTSKGVTVSWELGRRAKLAFSLSYGHLFDPHNLLSTWGNVVEKGRVITLRFGEKVGGTDYWVNQGTFVVQQAKMSYGRGKYPVMQVEAEDMGSLYEYVEITASDGYEDAEPFDVLVDLIVEFTTLSPADLNFPVFATTHNVWYQVVEEKLQDWMDDFCAHFGYVPYWAVDGRLTALRVNPTKAIDHVYTDAEQIIDFSPDDSFANLTNRVTVEGETHDFLEVLMDKESVARRNGTIGWWSDVERYKVYYDQDRERQCRNPELEIHLNPTNYQGLLDFFYSTKPDQEVIYISDEDFNELWVEVTVEGPNWVAEFIAFAALYIASIISPTCSACDYAMSCGACFVVTGFALLGMMEIASQIGQYDFEIFAQPVGHEKQTIQASADDEELQQKLNGQIVEDRFNDPLAYTVQECQRVADYELSIVQAQRRQLDFTKLAHLQDEIGDAIQIVHPVSQENVKVFITKLTRKFSKPERPGGRGAFTDKITGWRQVSA